MPPTQAVDRPPMLTRMVRLGRSFAPIPGLANPARSFACLEMAPTLWGPSSRLQQPGAWIPPTPSGRVRLDAVGTAIAKAILVPMRGASVLRPVCGGRLPCPSQAPTTPAPPGPDWPSRLLRDSPGLPCSRRNPCPGSLPRPPVRDPTPGATCPWGTAPMVIVDAYPSIAPPRYASNALRISCDSKRIVDGLAGFRLRRLAMRARPLKGSAGEDR